MAQIYLPTPLRRLTHGQAKVAVEGRTVEEALGDLERRYPGLREQLREPSGQVRRFINIFVNGAEIGTLQGPATALSDADEVSIIPAMAGGTVSGGSRVDAAPVQQRLPSAARAWPVLRVFETARVLLHEQPDPERVRRLVQSLRGDGVLRNPPVVASGSPLPGGTVAAHDPVVVLDGANRVTALREIGAAHIAAQLVEYGAAEISVSTWTHYVTEDGEPLRRRIAAHLGQDLIAAVRPDEARRRLAQDACIAVLMDADGAAVIGPQDSAARADLLEKLVAVYAGTAQVYRSETADLDALRAEFGPGAAVQFPVVGKDDIVRLAMNGRRLPAGITRHLIPGRVLRLNVPLAWLEGPESAVIKQSRLDDSVQARVRAHGARYYAEATYLFDE